MVLNTPTDVQRALHSTEIICEIRILATTLLENNGISNEEFFEIMEDLNKFSIVDNRLN